MRASSGSGLESPEHVHWLKKSGQCGVHISTFDGTGKEMVSLGQGSRASWQAREEGVRVQIRFVVRGRVAARAYVIDSISAVNLGPLSNVYYKS